MVTGTIRTVRGGHAPSFQVTLERAALSGSTHTALASEHARRAEEVRRWRENVRAKVREGRLGELTPEERGWILSALEADSPDA
jgi:hypothetical protein